MKNIDKILKENLKRKYQMNESFERISLIEDENERFGSTIDYFGKLIDEGYSNNEIESVVNEQIEWLKKLFGGNKVNPADATSSSTLFSNAGQGGFSQFKEYLVSKLLGYIGFEGPLANALATAFTEMSIMDIISVFRSRQGCVAHGPDVADAVSEALVRYIIETNTKENSIAYNFLRNTIFVYIKSSNFGETLAKMICDATYGMKGKIQQKLAQNTSPTQQPLPS